MNAPAAQTPAQAVTTALLEFTTTTWDRLEHYAWHIELSNDPTPPKGIRFAKRDRIQFGKDNQKIIRALYHTGMDSYTADNWGAHLRDIIDTSTNKAFEQMAWFALSVATDDPR